MTLFVYLYGYYPVKTESSTQNVDCAYATQSKVHSNFYRSLRIPIYSTGVGMLVLYVW